MSFDWQLVIAAVLEFGKLVMFACRYLGQLPLVVELFQLGLLYSVLSTLQRVQLAQLSIR